MVARGCWLLEREEHRTRASWVLIATVGVKTTHSKWFTGIVMAYSVRVRVRVKVRIRIRIRIRVRGYSLWRRCLQCLYAIYSANR